MIIVTGISRGGTSLMMDCLRRALGPGRICGEAFPQDRQLDRNPFAVQSGESQEAYAARQYVLRHHLSSDATIRRLRVEADRARQARDLNPHGFWEDTRYAVRGLAWRPGETLPPDDAVVKVVCRGLPGTDPSLVDKIVCILRHPRQVAKSQENFDRVPFATAAEEKQLGRVHDPRFFLRVWGSAAAWIASHSDIPIHLVEYDALLADPAATLDGLRAFLGEGDFSTHPVDPNLRRSVASTDTSELWDHAEAMWDLLTRGRWQEAAEYSATAAPAVRRGQGSTYCCRLRDTIPEAHCRNCLSGAAVDAFRRRADRAGIDWGAEPCIYECWTRTDGVPLRTIDESINANHWWTT